MRTEKTFTNLYLVIVVLNLVALVFESEFLRYLVKPLIMLWLLGWAMVTPDRRKVARKSIFLIGLIMACLGDVFLMFSGYFLAGLASFCIMQITYIIVFWPEIEFKRPFLGGKVGGMLIVLVTLMYLILPSVTDPVLKTAVAVYAFVITTMTLGAFLRKRGVSQNSYRWVGVGAVLFLISDTLIAYGKFVAPIAYAGIWIMATYMAAQYMIVRGMLKVY